LYLPIEKIILAYLSLSKMRKEGESWRIQFTARRFLLKGYKMLRLLSVQKSLIGMMTRLPCEDFMTTQEVFASVLFARMDLMFL